MAAEPGHQGQHNWHDAVQSALAAAMAVVLPALQPCTHGLRQGCAVGGGSSGSS